MALPEKPTIPAPPDAPVRGDEQATFATKANAFVAWQSTSLKPALDNSVNWIGEAFDETGAQVVAAQGSAAASAGSAASSAGSADQSEEVAQIAIASANFKGAWTTLSGALDVPASTFHQSSYWMLMSSVGNVSAAEPGVSAAWQQIQTLPIVRTPEPIDPLSGATNVAPQPLLDAIGYANVYDTDARDTREFQVDLAAGDFSDPVYTFAGNVDSHTVVDSLAFSAAHKWRCRDVSVASEVSRWSSVQGFSTGSVSIAQPTLTVTDSPNEVPESPALETSAFAVVGGSDDHLNTDWQVLDAQLEVVWESLADGDNKLLISVPAGVLDEDTPYTFRARHRGEVYGVSTWASVVATTEAVFFDYEDPANVGEPIDGGILAGIIVSDYDSQRYALIVSDGGGDSVQLGAGTMQWRTTNAAVTSTHGTPPMTLADGAANHAAVRAFAANMADFPAFAWVDDTCNAGGGLNGYTDWYLPARDELELCYRHFKPSTTANATTARSSSGFGGDGLTHGTNANSDPTGAGYTAGNPAQTALTNFRTGGNDSFEANSYWSSTENDGTYAWVPRFNDGHQFVHGKTNNRRVRAARRVAL